MRVVLFCPFTAGALRWQAQSGAWTLSVCVRGTFALVHGREAVLADAQEPIGGDVFAGDDPSMPLRAPSDLVPYKPRVDVLVVGSAFAPDHQPVDALVARVTLGAFDKSIGVIGDRTWIEGPDGPEPSAPATFREMPLGSERAARSRENPHGFDLAARPRLGKAALPNLEAIDDGVGGRATPTFGPIAPRAGARRGLLRPEAWAWADGGGRGPAPAGFDFAFYNAAPRDQQIDAVRAGELLVLENLNRERARLETRLPSVRPRAFLVPAELERGFEIALRCDTVWIDTDRALCTLSWRGLATVDTPDEEALGSVVVAAESKGREVGYAQIARLVRDGGTTSTDSDTFGDLRAPTPRGESAPEIDPDLIPTPGPFRAKRPLAEHAAHTAGAAARVPAATPAPVVIRDEEPSGPASWRDEITGSDLLDASTADEPKTLTRLDARSLAEEPAPRPRSSAPGAESSPLPDLAASDHARIAVAVERGDAARTLIQYGLGLADLGRVERASADRSARDPAFAASLAEAIGALRRR